MTEISSSQKKAPEKWLTERWRLCLHSPIDLPFVIAFTAAVTGILIESWLSISPDILFPLSMVTLFVGIGLSTFFQGQATWSILWLGVLVLYASIHGDHLEKISRDRSRDLATKEWSPIVFEATIDSVPRWRPDLFQYEASLVEPIVERKWQTLFELELDRVRDRSDWVRVEGRVTLTVDGNIRSLLPGDRVRVFGNWQRIPEPTNPGQFDLADFYRRKGQFVRVRSESVDQVQPLESHPRWRLDRWMGWILEKGDSAIQRHVGFDQAMLASALVLGQRDQVEWELQESLLATGTMHMLAISGLHVEMVAISIVSFALLLHLPRKPTLMLVGGLVVCYGVLCGGQPPVVRAVILVVTVCIARWMGRPTHSMNLLAFAGLVLLWMRTTNLFDVGTQLSFLAVAMLSMLSMHPEVRDRDVDPLKQLIYETSHWWHRLAIDAWHFSWDMLRTSAWIWLVTTPLVLSTFHVISPIAILLNLVLWFPLLVALLSGLGVALLGAWIRPFGDLLGSICGGCLWFTQETIEFAERIPGGHWWMPAPSIGWTLLFYCILLALWLLMGFSRVRRPLAIVALTSWCLIGLIPGTFGPHGKFPLWRLEKSKPLQLTAVDVGHGSAMIIECPDGSVWLYDAGRLGDGERSFQNIASVLWNLGVARIDGIFLSHADTDHYNGIGGLAKRFVPSRLETTSQVLTHSSASLRHLLKGLERQRVELNLWSQGGRMERGPVIIEALHPPSQGLQGSDNANSLCLLIRYADRSLLLTGDLEAPGTDLLMRQCPTLPIDVLLAPHHGSITQNPQPLLKWCTPAVVLISGGPRAVRDKVLEAYSAEQRKVLVTHRDGALKVEIEENGALKVHRWDRNVWSPVPLAD